MQLKGNTVLITGGGSGIGFALAQQLAERGNQVIIAGRDADRLAAARSKLPQAIAIQADVSRGPDRFALAEQLLREHPQLNVLINNAGIQLPMQFGSRPELAAIEAEVSTNLVGPMHLCALLAEQLMRRPAAAIVNISSGLAIAPKADAPVYCATKAALSSFSRSLRYQLQHTSVKVFDIIAPMVDTDMTRGRGRGKLTPSAFAAAMLRGLEQDAPTVYVGKTRLLAWLHRLLPAASYRLMQ